METIAKKLLWPIEELFKKTFALYKTKALLMFLLILIAGLCSLATVIPFALLGLAILLIGQTMLRYLFLLLLFLVAILFIIMIALWFKVALFYSLQEDSATIKGLLKKAWGKMGPYYWVLFLRGLIVLAGFILFVIPGIVFGIWFAFSQYALVFEDTRGGRALSRSKELVKGYFWPIFGRFFLWGIMVMLISLIPGIGSLINLFFSMPFGIVYLYCIYQNLKEVRG